MRKSNVKTPIPEGMTELEFRQILAELEENEGYKWFIAEIERRIVRTHEKMRAPIVTSPNAKDVLVTREEKVDMHNSNVARCATFNEVLKMVPDRKNG